MEIKVIVTGATGLVGEGVILTCLEHADVKQVLMVNRRHSPLKHPKLQELLVPDFSDLTAFSEQLTGYDACFYCAGVSSVGVSEEEFTKKTYDVVVPFAEKLAAINPNMIFNFVSGNRTDSSETGSVMWARVKGRTENALMRLPFKNVYNFRPGFMKPMAGQKNVTTIYKVFARLYPVWLVLFPKWACTMREVGQAMINSVLKGYSKQILEVKDIQVLARQ
ncbi:NAD-dependent epimerase/dehydratase family protein [Spirosoma sp. HMF4905]|uniref:NAD-dependent epimerase/dehydratase family protein n=1 Tax=Spirosoma arboris TaxID=2682092 RepID=A0A7K1SC18_9BACT|nr:NAD-dependent epimerase/dehydratase family protein [Spirosoma arboris]MVM31364.1 NAD-dependent epimerase/dehydratase family protein [Spirosoma arboris]